MLHVGGSGEDVDLMLLRADSGPQPSPEGWLCKLVQFVKTKQSRFTSSLVSSRKGWILKTLPISQGTDPEKCFIACCEARPSQSSEGEHFFYFPWLSLQVSVLPSHTSIKLVPHTWLLFCQQQPPALCFLVNRKHRSNLWSFYVMWLEAVECYDQVIFGELKVGIRLTRWGRPCWLLLPGWTAVVCCGRPPTPPPLDGLSTPQTVKTWNCS